MDGTLKFVNYKVKVNCQAMNSSIKRMNEYVFTTMRRVFVRFLEEIEDTQKTFRNYLTFSSIKKLLHTKHANIIGDIFFFQ